MRSWIIERDIFPENEAKLEAVLGDRITWAKMNINGPEFSRRPVEGSICYATHTMGRRLQTSHGAISWLYEAVYDCHYYLPHFQGFALNNPHIFVERGTIHMLLDALDAGETKFFIKENSGYKNFTGLTGTAKSLERDLDRVFDTELLMLAPAKQIGAEWRYVITSDPLRDEPHQILTSSPYGELKSSADPTDFVRIVLNDPRVRSYDSAPMWTLDVCELPAENGCLQNTLTARFAVVEVNSLLSAGWYDCDVGLIAETVDKIAGSLL
jgi:hypothetical protein